jgi:glycosyltransferase involved in cell wall biosynthesis
MRIVIWTGPAWETWGPASLKTGIGGSELAAIHMASWLSRLGHEVEIVGQVTPETWNGVRFVDFRDHVTAENSSGNIVSMSTAGMKGIECDVFVSSRTLPALRLLQPRARLSVLWMHDIHVGPDPHGFLKGYDIILNLSGWARDTALRYYPGIPRERFVVTRNGIDTALFSCPVEKKGCKAVYSSSPDRGLDKLLDWWPAIREMQPDAELHVYYGFDTWERMADLRRDRIAKLQIGIFRARLARMEELGVASHGRVGQEELAKAWMGASLWLYPTSFSETSCITAMEAQAAMAWPITSSLAALRETVRHGVLIDPPNTRDGYREEFLGHVRSYLEGRTVDRLTRQCLGRDWAMDELDWKGVAEQWEQLFTDRMK